jgi:hypothetical protein
VNEVAEALHQLRGWVDPEDFHNRMRADPHWAAGVRIAGRAGIPLSQFHGRVPAAGEPLWLPEDRDTAVAFELWSSQVCGGCGLHPLDWPDEQSETYKGRISTCHGCREMADSRATIPNDVSDTHRAAIRVFLVPRPAIERLILDEYDAGRLDNLEDFNLE